MAVVSCMMEGKIMYPWTNGSNVASMLVSTKSAREAVRSSYLLCFSLLTLSCPELVSNIPSRKNLINAVSGCHKTTATDVMAR